MDRNTELWDFNSLFSVHKNIYWTKLSMDTEDLIRKTDLIDFILKSKTNLSIGPRKIH